MNLDFGRCQVYKLNISACLTERELDYYNLFCDGITRKELKKRLGVDYPTSEMLSEEFHISLEDAADLLKAQMNKKCFRKFLTDEIEKFSPNEVREIRKSAIYVADEEGNLTDRIKDNKKIVWFGNECVRRCNVDLKDIPLLDQFLLLKCGSKALTGVLNQIVERGVNLDGKHYLFYTSTTGQMKETEIKHLYPVTEKQYEKLTELQEESAAPLSEEVIMDVINSVEYKQDGWNPYKYRRSMCGIGYHGCNDADSESISFKKWKNMMQRCYDKNVHKKYKPEYKDKTICEEWLNYANFRIWFDEHYVPGKWQIDLDKDLLVQGNKEYSPETCVFLEHYQNTMFEHNAKDMIYENEDGTFFIGKGRKKTYATYEEAVDIICGRNKKRIENEIEKSLGKIPMCAHEAMLKWDVRAAV